MRKHFLLAVLLGASLLFLMMTLFAPLSEFSESFAFS